MPCYHGSTTTNNKEGIVKIKPQNHKKKKKRAIADSRPVDAFRQAPNNNTRRNGMVKIGAIIDEIIVTRNHK